MLPLSICEKELVKKKTNQFAQRLTISGDYLQSQDLNSQLTCKNKE